MPMSTEFAHYLNAKRQLVEAALAQYGPQANAFPPLLHEAMRYSLFAGGKRLRPIMVLMAAELLEKPLADVAFAAAADEMIHTYSLIHDDLPAMDDDDLRRGMPTNHKKYGEDMAILAGDALLTLAFEVVTDPRHTASCSPTALLRAAHELGQAAGSRGMVGGQVLDLQAEGRTIDAAELDAIHVHKTGKMITVSLRIGAILAGAGDAQLEALSTYGDNIGLAFQIVDDVLDIKGSPDKLGKNVQSDLEHHKATYPALYGLDESKALARKFVNDAKLCLQIFPERTEYFIQLAEYIISRTS